MVLSSSDQASGKIKGNQICTVLFRCTIYIKIIIYSNKSRPKNPNFPTSETCDKLDGRNLVTYAL